MNQKATPLHFSIPNLQSAFGVTKLAPKSERNSFADLELETKIWWAELVYIEQKSSLKSRNDSLQYFQIITEMAYSYYKETNRSENHIGSSGLTLFQQTNYSINYFQQLIFSTKIISKFFRVRKRCREISRTPCGNNKMKPF